MVAIDADTASGTLGARIDPHAVGSYWDLAADYHLDTFSDGRTKVGANADLAVATVPGAIVIFQAPGVASADVCVSGGRRVSVSGCANIADAVAPYVPPPAYYAPLPEDPTPNVYGRVSYNGRWVDAAGCN